MVAQKATQLSGNWRLNTIIWIYIIYTIYILDLSLCKDMREIKRAMRAMRTLFRWEDVTNPSWCVVVVDGVGEVGGGGQLSVAHLTPWRHPPPLRLEPPPPAAWRETSEDFIIFWGRFEPTYSQVSYWLLWPGSFLIAPTLDISMVLVRGEYEVEEKLPLSSI